MWFVLKFLSKKIYFIYFFFAEFELRMFHNNIVKISEKLDKRNLLKICLQVMHSTFYLFIYLFIFLFHFSFIFIYSFLFIDLYLHNLHSFLLWENENICLFLFF